jgi:hypothetical protein
MTWWMKVALAAAVLGALGAIVATVWVGSKVREETVVPNPYEEGLRHTVCDAGAAPCTQPLGGGGTVTLDVGPRPVRTMVELTVTVRLSPPSPRGPSPVAEGGRGEGARVTVSFSMPGMEMGRNEIRLAPSGDGRFSGTGVLVRCPSGRRDWAAEVRVEPPGAAPRAARFAIRAEE